MAEEHIIYTKDNGIGIITLNRPEKLNATTRQMNYKLRLLAEEIKTDNEVRVVILTGNGRAFCAGTDLSDYSPSPIRSWVDRVERQTSTDSPGAIWTFTNIPKPVICAINGVAVGVGAEYVLECDIRIAAESARFGEVFVLRGMVPDMGAGTYLLPRIVGLSKACELVFSGEIIDAQEMLRIGLVSKVVPNEQLMPAAMEMAKKLTKGAPLAVKMSKQLMYMGLERTMNAHQEAERFCFSVCTETEDVKEGIKAFLEKREPRWTGKYPEYK